MQRPNFRSSVPAFVAGVLVTVIFYKMTTSDDSLSTFCTDWLKIPAEFMGPRQIIEYLKWTNGMSCQEWQHFGGEYHLFSGMDGQKAICLDAPVAPDRDDCLVYSFGINNEWSFDEAMQEYGCDVYAFDPSMGMDTHQHSEHVRFYNIGLGYQDFIRSDWKMRRLSSIYKMLQHRHGNKVIDYLKIDIEGDEWNAITDIIASGMLPKIRQMAIEIHMWPVKGTLDHHRRLIQTLQMLEDHGMVRFDSRANPTSHRYMDAFGFSDYCCYEMVWYNSHQLQRASNSKNVQNDK